MNVSSMNKASDSRALRGFMPLCLDSFGFRSAGHLVSPRFVTIYKMGQIAATSSIPVMAVQFPEVAA